MAEIKEMRSLFALKTAPRTLGTELVKLFKVVSGAVFAATVAAVVKPEFILIAAVAFPVSYLLFELLARCAAAVVLLIVCAFAIHYFVGFYLVGVTLLGLLMFVEFEDPRFAKRGRGQYKANRKNESSDDDDWSFIEMGDPYRNLKVNGWCGGF